MNTKPSTRRVGFRMAIVLAAVALVAVACGSEDATTSTTAASTTSTQAVATTAPTTVPPTTAAPTTTSVPATTDEPTTTTISPTTTTTVPYTSFLADGSGCTPGTTGTLPDGEWFGYVAAATTGQLDFDLACWFTGDAAADAAAEDGEESPPPNDYYVRNSNDAIRTLDVADDAAVRWLPNAGDPTTEEVVAYSDWLTGRTGRDYQPGVWLIIEGGAITDIQEQYVP